MEWPTRGILHPGSSVTTSEEIVKSQAERGQKKNTLEMDMMELQISPKRKQQKIVHFSLERKGLVSDERMGNLHANNA